MNFTRATATVACGGTTAIAALDALCREGFRTVVNLRLASEPGADLDGHRDAARRLGLAHVHVPLDSAHPHAGAFDRFLEVMDESGGVPVYVHCVSANRVGAVWLAKRVLQDGLALDRALAEARTIGLRAAPLEAFALDYIAARGGAPD
ncbi:MAG: sulfur transferase domain-containing protein [Vicinamibacterales bacterium]